MYSQRRKVLSYKTTSPIPTPFLHIFPQLLISILIRRLWLFFTFPLQSHYNCKSKNKTDFFCFFFFKQLSTTLLLLCFSYKNGYIESHHDRSSSKKHHTNSRRGCFKCTRRPTLLFLLLLLLNFIRIADVFLISIASHHSLSVITGTNNIR